MPDSRYRITERVASGGMAEVFKGVAESLQGFKKSIAIKRVLPSLTQNKKFVAMFLDEARLSLALQHANIVQVFDIGHADDTYFIVMEFVDGVDLKILLEWRRRMGKRLPTAVSLNIANEICKGLSYAHELVSPDTGRPLGIVHRDVSPPNVLISKQGEVKVVDFGLAKAASQLETTDPGVVKGKMSYLSPEAARGEEVDSRADIFSVGILLYEMLTGKRLFYGESDYQTVELVRNAKIPPIKAQNPEVEQELEDIVRKALALRKEDRFQTATDLQDALAHYSYSRGLKVISRDVADLVRQCLEDRAASSGGKRRPGNILDTLLQDEINKMTSVDFEDPGSRPLSGDELGPRASGTSDLIDPRAWAFETGSGKDLAGLPASARPTGAVPLGADDPTRATLKDNPAIVQAAVAAGNKSGGAGKVAAGDKSGSAGKPVAAAKQPSGGQRVGGARGAPAAAGGPTGAASNARSGAVRTPSWDQRSAPRTAPDALAPVLEPAAVGLPKAPVGRGGFNFTIRGSRGLLIGVLVGVIVLSIAALAGILVSRRSHGAAVDEGRPATATVPAAAKERVAAPGVVVPLRAPAESRRLASGADARRASARP
jgi:serine/threonine-protein kinase